ncbi:IGF-like family receptor 1 isoform X2 [Etheostoma spectabile]|uniref:IGF-like family receptor 1 isoform X2 n=1 Tax=Etheostoma spectabile TaxID=54343 RepID=UPI0013AF3C23|nr:IGF-like family receptor 1 isoform X2 [Etheostoma spectabile]
MMGHSERCSDPTTFWNRNILKCEPCTKRKGYEITPNCGNGDDGSKHDVPHKRCKANTFNDGSGAYCKPCSLCPLGFTISSPCTTTTDTKCEDPRTNTVRMTLIPTNQGSSLKPNEATSTPPSPKVIRDADLLWAVPLVTLVSILLVLVACLIYMKRKRGQHTVLTYSRRSSYVNSGFSPLSAPPGNNDLEEILSPNILSAPLQTVLDNLDVLEELVILLDPESQGVKNTKHLASFCSFPATWITYTYSMKESKSPLKAVLEGVTSRHPDLTVGYLAKLLKRMERNDAIAVLGKLGQDVMQV